MILDFVKALLIAVGFITAVLVVCAVLKHVFKHTTQILTLACLARRGAKHRRLMRKVSKSRRGTNEKG